ncbi:MAG: AAA family ATPase [Spirochaetes bacterium]|nr:AAA family ATPase [Spirochaetota bacterium]
MRLERIRLEPFGAFGNRELAFSPGLQVVLGPNEAGKSTFWNALYEVLFRPVLIDKRKTADREAVARFLPIGSGNHSRVSLAFSIGGDSWVLEKQWQTGAKAALTQAGGAALIGDEEVREKLQALFPVTPAVLQTVLLSRQGQLSRTLEEVKAGPALGTLSDLLRASLQDPGGVSVDAFMKELEAEHENALLNWDLAASGPKDGKLLSNRRKVNLGAVLKAYYAEQEASLAVAEAEAFESRLDLLNGERRTAQEAFDRNQRFLDENGPLEKGARSRRELEVECLDGRRVLEELTAVCDDWPVRKSEIQRLEAALPALHAQVSRLAEELDRAKRGEETRPLRELLKRARPEWVHLGELRESSRRMKAVSKAEVEALRRTEDQAKRGRLAVEAGQMQIAFLARTAQKLGVIRDGSAEEAREVAAGSALKTAAVASLRLEHPDWSLSIGSGSADAKALLDRLSDAEAALGAALAKLGVASLEEAASLEAASHAAQIAFEKQQGKLEALLAGKDFEELEAKLALAPPEESFRPVADLAVEKSRAESAVAQAETAKKEAEEKIAAYQSKYGERTGLYHRVGEATKKVADLQAELDALPSLPEGIKDPKAFLDEMDRARERSRGLQAEVSRLEIERAAHIGSIERSSADELRAEHREAAEAFRSCLTEARVLDRILAAARAVKERGASRPLDGLQATFQEYLATMTRGNYSATAVEEGLPTGVRRGDGEVLPYELLSAGTQDQFALGLRLAMAHYFLEGKEAFLVMDDPLVDMDPERQKGAAAALRAFAERQQLIVFTCHPSHADLFGGRRIELA